MKYTAWMLERLWRPREPPFQTVFEFFCFMALAIGLVSFLLSYHTVMVVVMHDTPDSASLAWSIMVWTGMTGSIVAARALWRAWPRLMNLFNKFGWLG
jgi:hypothetical protein